jgi:diguanylate cyclase (GGDEF)-like protein/PAS domain S-box-containing protein
MSARDGSRPKRRPRRGTLTRKRATARERQLEIAIENISQGICMFDAEGKIVLCNRRYIDMYGLSPEVVKPGCSLMELLRHRHEVAQLVADPDEVGRAIVASIGRGEAISRLIETRDGRVTHAVSIPIPVGGWVATHEDITERRKAERAAETAGTAAARAEAAALTAHRRLLDAFEVVPEGLALFDAEDRLILWNRRYAEMYPETGNIAAGVRFEDLLRDGLARGQYPVARGREETFLTERLSQHKRSRSSVEQQLSGDRWVRVEEQRTADGGVIGVRIDITDLKNREASFRLLFEHNPIPMFVFAQDSLRFLAVNDSAVAHYGYSRQQFLSMTALDIRPPEDRHQFQERLDGGPVNYREGRVWRHVTASGSVVDMAIFASHLLYEGQPALLVAAVDVTEQNRVEARLRETQGFLDTVIENVPVAIIVKNADDLRYVLINRSAEQFFGINRNDVLGRTTHDVLPHATADYIAAYDAKALASPDPIIFDEVVLDTPRRGRRVSSGRRMVVRSEGKPKYLLAVIQDVTERKEAEARIAHLVEHDPLTGLPNRAAFQQHLDVTLERAAASGTEIGVLRLGLDRFKETNDVFGQSIGDAALCEVGRRLESVAGDTFLARVGGDEFSLVVEGPQPAAAEALGERLQTAFGDFEIESNTLNIGASIGVAIFPGDGNDNATLVANADAALHRAKTDGGGIVRFFDGDMDRRLRDRRALQHDLRSALMHGELCLDYQPQMRIDRATIGFEALARWRHPTRGLVPPATFIPLAEESGLIFSISGWILREACREAASWPEPLQIAVNLSPIQFRQSDLVDLIRSIAAETGLAPNRLELEITEGVLIDDHPRAVAILTELKALGVRIVLDDFGTGYSSLSYLQSFPFDKIKIDRSFIANLPHNSHSASITRAIIALGHGLGLPILAEGVETEEQLAFLRRESCDQVQGFLLGDPYPMERHAALIGRAGKPAAGDQVVGFRRGRRRAPAKTPALPSRKKKRGVR